MDGQAGEHAQPPKPTTCQTALWMTAVYGLLHGHITHMYRCTRSTRLTCMPTTACCAKPILWIYYECVLLPLNTYYPRMQVYQVRTLRVLTTHVFLHNVRVCDIRSFSILILQHLCTGRPMYTITGIPGQPGKNGQRVNYVLNSIVNMS